ncbi:unnamed protein product [Gulo gulo]|uniref:60S ribosomal protein L23a n=1 Tax=Gulo gulo TaxID=48420 RepID=A0A9X9LFS2_GULGU|nr:unnamed protein product [Gulo gulo]
MKKIEDNTLVFIVDVKTNKQQVMKKLWTLMWPRSTPLTDPMERKHMSDWLLTIML